MNSLRNLQGRWSMPSIGPPLLKSFSSSRTEEEGGDAPNKRPKLDCQDIADKVRLFGLSQIILFSSSIHVAPYGFFWATYYCAIREYHESRGAKKCREEIPSELSISGGKFSSGAKTYQSRYIFVILR